MDTCRDGGGSYHVDYAVNEEGDETENLTHAATINSDAIAEHEESECGWIADADGERIRLLVSTDEEGGYDLCQLVTADTAEQLSDMFKRAAEDCRKGIRAAQEERDAEAREAAAIKALQPDLFAVTEIN